MVVCFEWLLYFEKIIIIKTMQIFELYFNPKLKENQVLDSFVYEPESIYEKKLGPLYVAGEIKNALPKSDIFLNNLAKTVKNNYYSLSAKSPEAALSQSLKKTNDFLTEEVKNNNVNWLGNLNFAALTINDLKLVFSKTGNLKILLTRNGRINDIGKNPNLQDIEPYPLKVFFNVISGKLEKGDVILVLTEEIFKFFVKENTIDKISKKSMREELNEKNLKEVLPSSFLNKDDGSKVSGMCLLIAINENREEIKESSFSKENRKRTMKISFREENKFSLKKLSYHLLKPFNWLKGLNILELKRIARHPKKNKSGEKTPSIKLRIGHLVSRGLSWINPIKFSLQLFKKINFIKKKRVSNALL